MELSIKIKVERETLENVFITAIEGGSNYWYSISDEAFKLIKASVPRDGVKAFSERLFEAVYDKGLIVPIHDVEDEDGEPLGYLNRETFQERLNKISEENISYLLSEMNDDGDAFSSDVVFQYLVLGEVVYG